MDQWCYEKKDLIGCNFKNLLFRNNWADLIMILCESSLHGPVLVFETIKASSKKYNNNLPVFKNDNQTFLLIWLQIWTSISGNFLAISLIIAIESTWPTFAGEMFEMSSRNSPHSVLSLIGLYYKSKWFINWYIIYMLSTSAKIPQSSWIRQKHAWPSWTILVSEMVNFFSSEITSTNIFFGWNINWMLYK